MSLLAPCRRVPAAGASAVSLNKALGADRTDRRREANAAVAVKTVKSITAVSVPPGIVPASPAAVARHKTVAAAMACKATVASKASVTAASMATTAATVARRHCAACHCCGADCDGNSEYNHFLGHRNRSDWESQLEQ
jgi:hypothetical protein